MNLLSFVCMLYLQTSNQLEAQWRATDYAFRKRLHETELAKNELEWKKENVSKSWHYNFPLQKGVHVYNYYSTKLVYQLIISSLK